MASCPERGRRRDSAHCGAQSGVSGRASCGVTFHGFTLFNGRVEIGRWKGKGGERFPGWMGLCGTLMRVHSISDSHFLLLGGILVRFLSRSFKSDCQFMWVGFADRNSRLAGRCGWTRVRGKSMDSSASPPQLHVSLHRFHPAPLLPCFVMAVLRRINPKDTESTPMECRRQRTPTAIPLPHSVQATYVVVCSGGTGPQGRSPVQVAPTTRQGVIPLACRAFPLYVSGRRKNSQVQGPIAHSFNINSASRYCQTGRKPTPPPSPPPLLPSKPCPTAIHKHPISLPMVLTASQHAAQKCRQA